MKDGVLERFGKEPNDNVRGLFTEGLYIKNAVCERVRSFGMPAGAELFETCEWAGRFQELATGQEINWHWLTRIDVKSHLCNSAKAKDANVRQVILDRFGGKEKALGRKAAPGPLYGVKADAWSALAIGLTWMDKQRWNERLEGKL
jgi:hypothetical protein